MTGIKWAHSLRLRELNGFDEEFLANTASDLASPTKTTELLARVSRLETDFGQSYSHDSISSLTKNPSTSRKSAAQVSQQDIADTISKMTIGDRTALLLNLRRLTLGEIMKCEIHCPLCSKIVSIDLTITNLLQPSEFDPKISYEIKVDNFNLVVRLPNGKDQEAIKLLDKNTNVLSPKAEPESSLCIAQDIIRSLIVSSDPPLLGKMSDDFIAKVSSELEKLDPQSNILLNITCPTCKHSFASPFFVEDFFFQEISARQSQLDHEIHWLAFYYHWSENDILSLSMKRRKRYVELINRSLFGDDVV